MASLQTSQSYLCYAIFMLDYNQIHCTFYNQMSEYTDEGSCQIFGIAGVLVQIMLGFLSFSVLVIKRYKQFPKRPWKIWFLDASKQAVSQMIAHFINIAISLMLSNHLSSDACIWYFTTNVLDNTIGVFFCCGVLRLIEKTIISGKCQQFRSGNYYDIIQYQDQNASIYTSDLTMSSRYSNAMTIKPLQITTKKRIILISYFAWFIQFLIWNIVVSICKTILFFIELGLNQPLSAFSQFFIGWVQPYPTLQLILVIIIIPVIMNGLAFWVQDNFLKKHATITADQLFKQPLI